MERELSQLVECISVSVSPHATAEVRRQAHEAFSHFKDNCPTSLPLALALLSKAQPDYVRHGGLLLLEHWVRLRWNEMSEEQRGLLKREALVLLEGGSRDISEEAPHVKEGLCKVVVEIVKREWPQRWPELLPQMFSTAQRGMTQAELVLLVLLRIAEDVVQLRMIDDAPKRRRDIYQALIDNVPGLFEFFFKILNDYYSPAQESNENSRRARVQLLRSLLAAITCYVEFVQLKEFLLDEVFRILCFLLNDLQLRLSASHCLCEMSSRKFKGAELEQLCGNFLKEEVMREILRSVAGSLQAPESCENSDFLLALCETLAGIARQLSAYILESTKTFECTSSYVDLVHAVIQLCHHSSCVVAGLALSAVTPLLRVQQRDSAKLEYPEDLWKNVCQMILKRLAPNDYPRSVWDFEDVVQFKRAYGKFKAELCELLRVAVTAKAKVTFAVGLQRLAEMLKENNCDEWAAMHKYLDTICAHLGKEDAAADEIKVQLCAAFDQLLLYKTNDLDVHSQVVSCISSLSPYAVHDDSRMGALLEVVFTMTLLERDGESRQTRCTTVKEYRKHGTALLVRLALECPVPMSRHFDRIRRTIVPRLDWDTVSCLERQHYMEALTIISNQLDNPALQDALLQELLVKDLAWMCTDAQLQSALLDVRLFVAYLGLQSVESFEAATESRVMLNSTLMTITGVMKRCKTVQGRHAAFELFNRTCLTNVLKLLWLFKELFGRTDIHPSIAQSMVCLGEGDKVNLFCDNKPSCDFPTATIPAAQNFISGLQENLTQFMCATMFRPEFYSIRSDMGCILINGLERLPAFKMSSYFHSVVKSFVKNCPDNLLLPQLSSTFVPLMTLLFNHLNGRWESLLMRSSEEETEATPEELIDDQVTYQMSRDLMEIVSCLILDPSKTTKTSDDPGADSVPSLTTFGEQLLADECASQVAVSIAFNALHWRDTLSSFKAIPICNGVAYHLVARERLSGEVSALMYRSLLMSLKVHGDNESHLPVLLTLGVQLYRCLSGCAGGVIILRELLVGGMGCSQEGLHRFEETLSPKVSMSARKRKDMFRSLVEGLLGKSVSEKGKEAVKIENLQPIWKIPKQKAMGGDSLVELFG